MNINLTRKSAIRNGFSLVELLVVIAIIALLMTIGVSVGYRVVVAANVKTTEANMAIIMNAIETFHDENGDYPDEGLAGTDRYAYSEFIITQLFEVDYQSSNDPANWLWPDDTIGKAKLSQFPDNQFEKEAHIPDPGESTAANDARRRPAFIDAFGKVMLYRHDKGLGGTPVLISAGPDGLFGPDIYYYHKVGASYGWNRDNSDSEYSEDNIRSDK